MSLAPLKEACWYWAITVLVILAMFIAGTPKVLAYVYSYWAVFVAFNAAECCRRRGSPMRRTFELEIFARFNHFNGEKWFELTEIESGEVLFEHEQASKVLAYAHDLMRKHPGKYEII